jgi:outer membrane immunogenic protein
MKTKNVVLSLALLVTSAMVAGAQSPASGNDYKGDAAVTYEWVRTNTQPGNCGCFYLNGGGVSGSWNIHNQWSAVGDFSAVHASDVPTTNASLTLVSYLGGARYRLPQIDKLHSLQPFAQGLFGGAHAGGGGAGEGDGSNAFMMRIGGGMDLPISQRFAVRLIQADYQMSTFANGSNDRQNNLLLAAGLVVHWSRSR